MSGSPSERMQQAVAHLAAGHYRTGWALYEARWEFPAYPGNHLPFGAARLQSLDDAVGRRVLLWAEGASTDVLAMLRYVPLLAAQAGGVVLAVPPELKQLATSLAGIEVISDGDGFEAVDRHVPLMSLPFLFRTRMATVPVTVPYLLPPAEAAQRWGERLPAATSPRVLVSLPQPEDDGTPPPTVPVAEGAAAQAMAKPGSLLPLFSLPRLQFHWLQPLANDADRTAARALPGLHIHDSAPADLAELAGLIRHMALVICSDGPVAHVAGAMGVPVWIALSAKPHWLWMTDRIDSPWYPTARLFRQPVAGGWADVIASLRDALWRSRPSIILS